MNTINQLQLRIDFTVLFKHILLGKPQKNLYFYSGPATKKNAVF